MVLGNAFGALQSADGHGLLGAGAIEQVIQVGKLFFDERRLGTIEIDFSLQPLCIEHKEGVPGVNQVIVVRLDRGDEAGGSGRLGGLDE
jgi:hypothetical protein